MTTFSRLCADCTRLSPTSALLADPESSYCTRHKRILSRFRYLVKVKNLPAVETAMALLDLTADQAKVYVAIHSQATRGRPRKLKCPNCQGPSQANTVYCVECEASLKKSTQIDA